MLTTFKIILQAVRSPSRGRPGPTEEEEKATAQYEANHGPAHAGRGGFGNVRSPSRDPADREKVAEEEKKEHATQVEASKKEATHPHHAGRGGAGNIRTDSKDRGDERGRNGGIGQVSLGSIENFLVDMDLKKFIIFCFIAKAIRNFSRSRSRDAKASPKVEGSHGDPNLGAVDESSSTLGDSTTSSGKPGIVGKIASHLPGSHH